MEQARLPGQSELPGSVVVQVLISDRHPLPSGTLSPFRSKNAPSFKNMVRSTHDVLYTMLRFNPDYFSHISTPNIFVHRVNGSMEIANTECYLHKTFALVQFLRTHCVSYQVPEVIRIILFDILSGYCPCHLDSHVDIAGH